MSKLNCCEITKKTIDLFQEGVRRKRALYRLESKETAELAIKNKREEKLCAKCQERTSIIYNRSVRKICWPCCKSQNKGKN